MLNRRDFIQLSISTLGTLAASRSAAAERRALGVQLYTVRKQAERDLPGVLSALHDMGYQEVELYWNIYNHPAPELRALLAKHGLRVRDWHVYGGRSVLPKQRGLIGALEHLAARAVTDASNIGGLGTYIETWAIKD